MCRRKYCGTHATSNQIVDTAAIIKNYLENKGNVSTRQESSSIGLVTLVESSYLGLGVNWNFLPTSLTVNGDWYSNVQGSANDVNMKATFNTEDHYSDTLHIYIVGDIQSNGEAPVDMPHFPKAIGTTQRLTA
ncbi:hypothetical protein DXG01_006613 [Tephrocybe rancida]|nr:hypothetical protein DXG01_006613 [Tephrocybe rancida]